MMDFLVFLCGWLAVACFASIPFIWIGIFYYKIRCRKVEGCSNRKCKYWQYCKHNYVERKKDELESRRQMLLYSLRLMEEELEHKCQ